MDDKKNRKTLKDMIDLYAKFADALSGNDVAYAKDIHLDYVYNYKSDNFNKLTSTCWTLDKMLDDPGMFDGMPDAKKVVDGFRKYVLDNDLTGVYSTANNLYIKLGDTLSLVSDSIDDIGKGTSLKKGKHNDLVGKFWVYKNNPIMNMSSLLNYLPRCDGYDIQSITKFTSNLDDFNKYFNRVYVPDSYVTNYSDYNHGYANGYGC